MQLPETIKPIPTTKAEKAAARVEIARDAVKQLALGEIISQSTYFRGTTPDGQVQDQILYPEDFPGGELTDDARGLLAKLSEPCGVCAKGALLVSYVRQHDAVPARALDGNDPSAYLRPLFDRHQLELIESAYEGWNEDGNDDEKEARPYYLAYDSKADRLLAILLNIIDNNGTFVQQYYDELRPVTFPEWALPAIHDEVKGDGTLPTNA